MSIFYDLIWLTSCKQEIMDHQQCKTFYPKFNPVIKCDSSLSLEHLNCPENSRNSSDHNAAQLHGIFFVRQFRPTGIF